jgi:hypothetical protein
MPTPPATPKDRTTEDTTLYTIRDAVEGPHGLGVSERDGEHIVIVRLNGEGKPVNHLYPEVADERIGASTFITSGRMKLGTISPKKGRTVENIASIFTLPVDCDLPDLIRMTPAEIHALPARELDGYLDELQEEFIEVCRTLGLSPTRISRTGYGILGWFDIADEDQHRVDELRGAYKRLVAVINTQAGRRLADHKVTDAGSRFVRLPGSLNVKGPVPRPSFILHDGGGTWTVDALCAALDRSAPAPEVRPPAQPVTPSLSAIALLPAVEKEIVRLVAPHWESGQRHELALGLAGWLFK